MIEKIAITSRNQWLSLRQQDVTASIAAGLLGSHPFATFYGIWALKTGRVAEEEIETPAMQRGRLLEPVAVQLLREKRPEWDIEPDTNYYRDPDIRLGATPDAIAHDPERGQGVIQIKSVERGIFKKKWRDEETGDVEPPLWIAVQALVEAHLTGSKWAAIAALVVSHGIDVEIVEVPLHPGVIGRLHNAVDEFWAMIAAGKEPSPDYGRDGKLLERMFNRDDGTEIDLSTDNRIQTLIAERESASATKGEADKRLKEIKAEILAKMGPASAARLADGRLITAKTVHRKEYVAKATSYRDIKVRSAAP